MANDYGPSVVAWPFQSLEIRGILNLIGAVALEVGRKFEMKSVAMSAMILCSTLAVSIGGASAQQVGKLFFEGDVIRGAQAGAPGPLCVLNNQFKHLEKVVFRIRVLDQAGNALDDKGLKSVYIELSNGQKLQAFYGQHPPRGTAADFFWTAAWIVPDDYPNGTFSHKVTATDLQDRAQSWQSFKIASSQFTVVAGAIELKK
jgi:hypothetical protein